MVISFKYAAPVWIYHFASSSSHLLTKQRQRTEDEISKVSLDHQDVNIVFWLLMGQGGRPLLVHHFTCFSMEKTEVHWTDIRNLSYLYYRWKSNTKSRFERNAAPCSLLQLCWVLLTCCQAFHTDQSGQFDDCSVTSVTASLWHHKLTEACFKAQFLNTGCVHFSVDWGFDTFTVLI